MPKVAPEPVVSAAIPVEKAKPMTANQRKIKHLTAKIDRLSKMPDNQYAKVALDRAQAQLKQAKSNET